VDTCGLLFPIMADRLTRTIRSEMCRALEPGGLALIAFHRGDEILRPAELCGVPQTMDFYLHPPARICHLLDAAGFAVEEVAEREPYPEVEYVVLFRTLLDEWSSHKVQIAGFDRTTFRAAFFDMAIICDPSHASVVLSTLGFIFDASLAVIAGRARTTLTGSPLFAAWRERVTGPCSWVSV
jgi:hypothetical protein